MTSKTSKEFPQLVYTLLILSDVLQSSPYSLKLENTSIWLTVDTVTVWTFNG